MFRLVLPLRKPDNQGRLVIIQRGTLHDPKKHKFSDLAKVKIKIIFKSFTANGVTMKYF